MTQCDSRPFFSLTVAASALGDCAISARDAAFIEAATQSWKNVRTKALGLPPGELPRLVFFDSHCIWNGIDGNGTAHDGTVALPDGESIPARLTTFAGAYGADDKPFFVFALEEIWRQEERYRESNTLNALMVAVFAHEMTHTVQTKGFGERLGAIEAKYKLELDDDLVQKRFSEREGFRAAYEVERDLLFAVAAEPDADKRRALARQAVRMIKERRARFFTGDDAIYAEIEEIFLGMEGAAQWSAYRSAIDRHATRDEAIELVRGRRKWFSQDEGLALFLAIDALMPKWPSRVFGAKPAGAWALLEEASR